MTTHDEPADLAFERDDEGSIIHVRGEHDIDLVAGPIEDVFATTQLADLLYELGERSDAWTVLVAIQRRWLAFTQELERAVGLAYLRGLTDQGKPPMKTTVVRDGNGQPIGTVAVPITPEEAARLEAVER